METKRILASIRKVLCSLSFALAAATANAAPSDAASLGATPCENTTDVCVIREQSVVTKYVGTPFTISWANCISAPTDPVQCDWHDDTWFDVEWYEAKLVDLPGQLPIATFRVVSPVRQSTWTPRKVGLYYARVRACNPPGDCSRWVMTWWSPDTDPFKWPRGFLVMAVLPPATGGGVQ